MERAVHKIIQHKRIRGEWFNITVDEAIAEIRHAIMLYGDNLRPKTAADRLAEYRSKLG